MPAPRGLVPGDAFEVREADGRIQLEPVGSKVRLEQREGGLVAVADDPSEPLTVERVRDLVERLRR